MCFSIRASCCMTITTLTVCSIIHGMSLLHDGHHGVLYLLLCISWRLHACTKSVNMHILVWRSPVYLTHFVHVGKSLSTWTPTLCSMPSIVHQGDVVHAYRLPTTCSASLMLKAAAQLRVQQLSSDPQRRQGSGDGTWQSLASGEPTQKAEQLLAYLWGIGIGSQGCLLEEAPQHLQALRPRLASLLGCRCLTQHLHTMPAC